MLAHATARTVEEQVSGVYLTADRRALRPTRLSRMIAIARAGQLNAALAAGADPSSCAQLAAHAAILSAPRTRTDIADQLDRLLRAVTVDARGRWDVRANSDAVSAAAGTINAISTLLRETTPVYARGIAIVSELLRDGTGPVYQGSGTDLDTALRYALAVMRTGECQLAARS